MGMYTELVLACALKGELPEDVRYALNVMLYAEEIADKSKLPKHPLFETERWDLLFTCSSYSFAAATTRLMVHNDIKNIYRLTVISSLKNYDKVIEKFIDWITPYIEKEYTALNRDDKKEFIGWCRYEEAEEPTLIYV